MYDYVCMAMYVWLCMYSYVCMAMYVWLRNCDNTNNAMVKNDIASEWLMRWISNSVRHTPVTILSLRFQTPCRKINNQLLAYKMIQKEQLILTHTSVKNTYIEIMPANTIA